MNKQVAKNLKQQLRKGRVRSRISGTEQRPRLSVFRSSSHIYAQVIDDVAGKTLAASSSEMIKATGKKLEQAGLVGKDIASKAMAKGLTEIVFDRGGYRYHGRVKALAASAREGGLKF